MAKILFTPAGSGMAITGIKALQDQHEIYATDIDRLAPGLHLANHGFLVPRFDEEGYVPALKDIVREHDIDVLIPALDPILLQIADQKKAFEELNCSVMLSDSDVIEITQDKWKTYTELNDRLPFPRSRLDIPDKMKDSLFIKPRTGSGSKGAHRADKLEELRFYHEKIEEPIIQEHLPGQEYTVDCISDDNNELVCCIPRIRIETKAGISVKGKVVDNTLLREMARKLARALDFEGPFFFQAKEDNDGQPKITEVASRTAGTMVRGFCSPNLHEIGVRMQLGQSWSPPNVQYGEYVSRYWEETYRSEDQLEELIDVS